MVIIKAAEVFKWWLHSDCGGFPECVWMENVLTCPGFIQRLKNVQSLSFHAFILKSEKLCFRLFSLNSSLRHWLDCHCSVARAIKCMTTEGVCVCVCWCISHQCRSSLPSPFPESTTDSLESNCESAVWVKPISLAVFCKWVRTFRTVTPVEVFTTCRTGRTAGFMGRCVRD